MCTSKVISTSSSHCNRKNFQVANPQAMKVVLYLTFFECIINREHVWWGWGACVCAYAASGSCEYVLCVKWIIHFHLLFYLFNFTFFYLLLLLLFGARGWSGRILFEYLGNVVAQLVCVGVMSNVHDILFRLYEIHSYPFWLKLHATMRLFGWCSFSFMPTRKTNSCSISKL